MNVEMIAFSKPYQTGRELEYVGQAAASGKLSGNGPFTRHCQEFFERRYGFRKCLLTTSGTSALEMAAVLTGVGPGDEVIVPSYTFVSTAVAFVRCGAKIVFADSGADNPNLDVSMLESLVTPRTKVIVPVHYAGVACDMDAIMAFAERHGILVVEDAAQAIDSFYQVKVKGEGEQRNRRPLGSIGHLGCLSFHETKNVTAGEGGMLIVNDERFLSQAEIVWEKGTNRAEFIRGEVNKYGWVSIGSAFAPSEINAAFLWAQLERLDEIQTERKRIWEKYRDFFSNLRPSTFILPALPDYATNNAHMFYLLASDLAARTDFIARMKERGVQTVAHFLPLHSSKYYLPYHDGRVLKNCDRIADTLVRLPLYCGLASDQDRVLTVLNEVLG